MYISSPIKKIKMTIRYHHNHHHHHHAATYPFVAIKIVVLVVVISMMSNMGPATSFMLIPSNSHSKIVTIKKISSNSVLFSTSASSDNNNNMNDVEPSYGEQSRMYRRDVFGYDNWVEHRSTNRFVGNLFDVLKSGVFRQLLPSCFYMSSIALFVILYNTALVDGYDDFSGLHHDPVLSAFSFLSFPLMKIPGDFFSLCTPSLALLLGTSMYSCFVVGSLLVV